MFGDLLPTAIKKYDPDPPLPCMLREMSNRRQMKY